MIMLKPDWNGQQCGSMTLVYNARDHIMLNRIIRGWIWASVLQLVLHILRAATMAYLHIHSYIQLCLFIYAKRMTEGVSYTQAYTRFIRERIILASIESNHRVKT